jgi:deazaflavin-dependent oxidoreductase (nitroreductase family)
VNAGAQGSAVATARRRGPAVPGEKTDSSPGTVRGRECQTGLSKVLLMSLDGEYVPSTSQWVRDQVEAYEASGGQQANTLGDTGLAVIIVTTVGNKSGKVRKTPLMRVEHDGEYALVASMGGAPKHPVWYYNLKADPEAVQIQDGFEPFAVRVHELSGEERATWWERAVQAFAPYADYQVRTERQIPVFVATRRTD